MDMQGQRVLHVTQAQAWDALNDPEILKSCIPGCDKFELTEANVYSVGWPSKLGLCLLSSRARSASLTFKRPIHMR